MFTMQTFNQSYVSVYKVLWVSPVCVHWGAGSVINTHKDWDTSIV